MERIWTEEEERDNARLLEEKGVAAPTVAALVRHIQEGGATGDFVRTVLENDLRGAIAVADGDNLRLLPEIVRWLHCYAPALCWGSPERRRSWCAVRRSG